MSIAAPDSGVEAILETSVEPKAPSAPFPVSKLKLSGLISRGIIKLLTSSDNAS